MADHFSTIGFPADSQEACMALAELAARSGQPIQTPHGYYIRWAPGEGVELWAQATLDRQVIGLHPHFSGRSRLPGTTTEISFGRT